MKLREVKFKAKKLSTGEWVEGDLYHDENGTYIKHPYKYTDGVPNSYQSTKVDPSTVCQYTGLKDCEGEEIWEHDLLKLTNNSSPKEVIFTDGSFMRDNTPLQIFTYKGLCDFTNVGSKFDKEDKG